MKVEITKWEYEFIRDSIEREFSIHELGNWPTQEEYDEFTKKLERLADKFKVEHVRVER